MVEIHQHPRNPKEVVYGKRLYRGEVIKFGDVYDSAKGFWVESIGVGLPIINDRFYWVRPVRQEK